jgi:hypothetical protein
LRDLGYNEIWLQNWLAAEPTRLGLGAVTIAAQEQTNVRGGSLDILAISGSTYYSIEVQLGEVDASHSFRVFEYWARNRIRQPGKTHVPVLIAESAAGRFRPALEALAEYLPLIVVELRVWQGGDEAIIVPEIVVKNESLALEGITADVGEGRTENDWREAVGSETWGFHEAFVAWTREHLGEVRVDYSPKSYIGVWRGRCVWAPIWPTRDGGRVNLPDPDGAKDEPSIAFERFRERLAEAGLEPSWQPTYNAGANPIYLRLRHTDLSKQPVQDLLRASFEILADGATPWSERAIQTLAATAATHAPAPSVQLDNGVD